MAKLQSDCKNRGVFEDSHFVTLLAFAHHPITRRLQKTLQNRSWRRPESLPKGASHLVAALKCFRDRFGTLVDAKWPAQVGPRSLPEAFRNANFSFWSPWKPPESILDASWTPPGWILDHFWRPCPLQNQVISEFVTGVVQFISPTSLLQSGARWRKLRSTILL